jgi:hypothetical protein
MIDKSLVIAIFSAIHPYTINVVDSSVIDGISNVAETEEEAAILVEYAWKESNGLLHPFAVSHDAKDHTSCGVFQLPCAWVSQATAEQQALIWISIERKPNGLESLDSSPRRAKKRKLHSLEILAKAKKTNPAISKNDVIK